MVTEIQCSEPDCVPIETLVAIFLDQNIGESVVVPRRYSCKILKPVVEVVEADVETLDIPFQFADKDIVGLVEEMERVVRNERITSDSNRKQTMELFGRYLANRSTIFNNEAVLNNNTSGNSEITPHSSVSDSYSIADIAPPSLTITRVKMVSTTESMEKKPSITRVSMINTTDSTVANQAVLTTNLTEKKSLDVKLDSTQRDLLPSKRELREVMVVKKEEDKAIARHNKEEKRRGCPCCDPDNLDHMLDKIMFMEYPPA
jgi:hypothetical protein